MKYALFFIFEKAAKFEIVQNVVGALRVNKAVEMLFHIRRNSFVWDFDVHGDLLY